MEIAAELYIIILGLAILAILFSILLFFYPLFVERTSLEASPDKVAKELADFAIQCWSQHRSGLERSSELCFSIDIKTSAIISEELFTNYLSCDKLPNSKCDNKQCNCTSQFYTNQDKVRWIVENNETTIKISYDGNTQQISIIDVKAKRCFNNVQDGDEEGIDCGGSCEPCESDKAECQDAEDEDGCISFDKKYAEACCKEHKLCCTISTTSTTIISGTTTTIPISKQISIDFSKTTGNINPLTRGVFSKYWVDRDDKLLANNRKIVEEAKKLAPALVLFGGGSSANYHWDPNRKFDPNANIWGHADILRTWPCVSPDGTYKPREYTLGGLGGQKCDDKNVQDSWMDFDEYMSFVQEIGAEPFVVVRYYGAQEAAGDPPRDIQRDANEAAAWVQYAKDKGYNVRYWQIGNEPYLPAEWGHVTKNQAQYALDFSIFYDKMKAVDPTIKIGAPVGYLVIQDPGADLAPENFCSDSLYGTGIFCQVLKRASKIDFLDVHVELDASDKRMDDLSLANWRRAMRSVVGSTRASQIEFVSTLMMIRDKSDTRCTNTASGNVCPSTLKRALAYSVALAKLAEEDFSAAALWVFRPPWPRQNEGILDKQSNPTPNYYALQLHTKHFGNKFVSVSPRYLTNDIVVYASKSNDGRKGYILVVNYHPSESFASNFVVSGANIASAKAFVLNGNSLSSTKASLTEEDLGSPTILAYNFAPHSSTVLELNLA